MTSTVAERMAASVVARHRAEVSSPEASPERRVVQVTESLRQEGILDRWHVGDDGFHLINGTCPYRKAAEISKLPCESDRMTIELLLGQDVEQVHRIVDGAPVCEYLVHPGQPQETNHTRQG